MISRTEFLERTGADSKYRRIPLDGSRYSQNLWRWVNRHMGPSFGFYFCTASSLNGSTGNVYDPVKNQAWDIYVGYMFDGSLIGSKLVTILGKGSKAFIGSFSGQDFVEVPELLKNYFHVGKCALDPEHKVYGSRGRYEQLSPKRRRCKWCGRLEKTKVVIRKEVTWIHA